MIRLKNTVSLGLILLLVFSITGCMNPPEGVSDRKGQELDKPINSIKDGLPYAVRRAKQMNDKLYLDFINAGFVGKESINKRKGEIGYFFYAFNAKSEYDANAQVDIDMKKNQISWATLSYGTAKQLGGGGPVLQPELWKIDIDQAFDIAMSVLDEEKILSYENPKIVIRCGKPWDFAVYASPESYHEEMLVQIDPMMGKVISVKK